jgi:hypothetical protein
VDIRTFKARRRRRWEALKARERLSYSSLGLQSAEKRCYQCSLELKNKRPGGGLNSDLNGDSVVSLPLDDRADCDSCWETKCARILNTV